MTPPSAIQSSLSEASRSWSTVHLQPGSRLLKLAVLRELERSLHALTSQYLAQGDATGAAHAERLEKELPALASAALSESTLEECLRARTPSGSPIPSSPSHRWEDAVGASKLSRHDRNWERAMTIEGFRIGWELWEARARVPISGVSRWNDRLVRELWPKAVLLFMENAESGVENAESGVENAESGVENAEKNGMAATPPGIWPGKWWLIAPSGMDFKPFDGLEPRPQLSRRA